MGLEQKERVRENSDEVYKNLVERIALRLNDIYESDDRRNLHKEFISHISLFSEIQRFSLYHSQIDLDQIIHELQQLSFSEKNHYIDNTLRLIDPLILLQAKHPIIMEDIRALISMKENNFTPLNSRISYGEGMDKNGNRFAHIHLASSFELKKMYPTQKLWLQAVRDLYEDGLRKLARIANEDKNFSHIISTSWLNATETYGNQKREMGFIDFVPLTSEEKEMHHQDEERPIVKCQMPRDVLLKRYLK